LNNRKRNRWTDRRDAAQKETLMKRNFLVTASPTPSFGNILKESGPFSAHLETFMGLHDLGRSAIYWACRGLRSDPGTQIWMPALHCGVDAQAAIDAGLKVGFYRLSDDLAIDEADLERRLRNRPGIVFVIHYFGFAQPAIERVTEECERRDCVLIEDCAHALFSRHTGRELGDFAPIAIFSLRKTLPIPDGGALKVNEELLLHVSKKPFAPPPPGEFSPEALFGYSKAAGRALLDRYLASTHGRERSFASGANFQRPQGYARGMSPLSRRVAATAEPAWIVDRRRRNYMALDQALGGSPGYRKVFDCLPEGACPLFLPIRVAERETLMAALRRQGVETFRFGAAPHPTLDGELLHETARLRDDILCLPVHDQITDGDVEQMAKIVRPLLARHALLDAREGQDDPIGTRALQTE
jgi:dTDP-4-amino-4,6-dideoxygalactose transaminase